MHPTVKPVALVADAIRDCSRREAPRPRPLRRQRHDGDRGRDHRPRAAGLELDPLYVDVAVRRWEKLTGKAAIHVETGLSRTALAAARGISTSDTSLSSQHLANTEVGHA